MNIRRILAVAVLAGVSAMTAAAQSSTTAPPKSAAQTPGSTTSPSGSLDTVLNLLDRTAAQFRDIQTDFVWDQYTKVVDEHDLQSGVMYFRRNGQNVEMKADINKAGGKAVDKGVLFAGGRVQVCEPKLDRLTEYSAGKNKADFESFLVLGFGGRGHDLQKSFDVKYLGAENVGGVTTYKLELTPKSQRVKGIFDLITLWIDKDRGVSVQQRFDKEGDYRLAKYSNIKINEKLGGDVFKLKTNQCTQVVRPNG